MDRLNDALASFRCDLDKDIETFLHEKAINFLDRGWCAVYLIVDEYEFDQGYIKVEAYFTLSHKSLIPSNASASSVKATRGFKRSESIHFVLIGQLGKYKEVLDDSVISSAITGTEVLEYAFEVIQASSSLIPCRCALVECSDDEKVQQFYKNNGFKYFQFDGDHHQFYKEIE